MPQTLNCKTSFGCDGDQQSHKCSIFKVCVVLLAAHLGIVAMALVGMFHAAIIGLVIVFARGSESAVAVCLGLTTSAGIIISIIRNQYVQDRIEKKADKAAIKAEETSGKMDTVVQSQAEVSKKQDELLPVAKAAVVVSRLGVKQNLEIIAQAKEIKTKVNGGLEAAKTEAYERGRADEREGSNPG